MSEWKFPTQPVTNDVYDGARVVEVMLRFPIDGASGGEMYVVRLVNGQQKGDRLHYALDPGEPDAMPVEMRTWLLSCLEKRGLVPRGAQPVDRKDKKAPKAEPERPFVRF